MYIEPREDWTVDQVLNWWLLHAKSETDAARDELISKLQSQLDQGVDRLWQDHEQVKAIMEGGNIDAENADPTGDAPMDKEGRRSGKTEASRTTRKATSTTTVSAASNVPTLKIEIVGGEYAGKIFELDNLEHEPAMVGRSRGKKVLKHGVSLPKDPEVSTTHGKFLAKAGGKVYFMDDGSTNGSMVNSQPIQSHVEIPLVSGMEIQVGATIMLVTF